MTRSRRNPQRNRRHPFALTRCRRAESLDPIRSRPAPANSAPTSPRCGPPLLGRRRARPQAIQPRLMASARGGIVGASDRHHTPRHGLPIGGLVEASCQMNCRLRGGQPLRHWSLQCREYPAARPRLAGPSSPRHDPLVRQMPLLASTSNQPLSTASSTATSSVLFVTSLCHSRRHSVCS